MAETPGQPGLHFELLQETGGKIVLLTTLTRIMENAFLTHTTKWTDQPRRTLINNGGLNTYLFVATRRDDGDDDDEQAGMSNRERKRRRTRARQAVHDAVVPAAAAASRV